MASPKFAWDLALVATRFAICETASFVQAITDSVQTTEPPERMTV